MQAWEEKILDHQEGRAEGLAEGRAEGLAEGKEQYLIQLIERKLARGKTVEEIADALEETPERIQSLIDKTIDESQS